MLAQRYPGDRFIGIEVFQEGIHSLWQEVTGHALTNVAVLMGHAMPMLMEHLPDGAIDWTVINFPDPWPKTRHHKRRLIQPDFLDLLAVKSRPGAMVSMATDWAEYAEWAMERFSNHPAWRNRHADGAFAPQPEVWQTTKFQRKGEHAGRGAWHLEFICCPSPVLSSPPLPHQ
jgi:tRNA (guanine-N7-)-methyltransferase